MIRNFVISAVFMLTFTSATYSQDQQQLKPFKVDISAGYGLPEGSGAKAGVLIALEPKYAFITNLSVGLRLEVGIFARASRTNDDGTVKEAEVKGAGSYLATADYYFVSNYGFRPFVGAGGGLYTLASATTSSEQIIAGGTKFGGMTRAGFEAHHFRLAVEYNIVPHTNGIGLNSANQVVPIKINNGYFGFKIGIVIGGGRR